MANIYDFLIFFYLFIFRETGEHRRGKERERRRIPSGLPAVSVEPNEGLKLPNREIMT